MKVNPDNTLDMEDFYAPGFQFWTEDTVTTIEAPAPPPPPEMPEAEVEGAPVKKPARKRTAAKKK